jgi:hypothetical protein
MGFLQCLLLCCSFKNQDQLPDAKAAEVAQKTQKIPISKGKIQNIKSIKNLRLYFWFDFSSLFCVFCATSAAFASGIQSVISRSSSLN